MANGGGHVGSAATAVVMVVVLVVLVVMLMNNSSDVVVVTVMANSDSSLCLTPRRGLRLWPGSRALHRRQGWGEGGYFVVTMALILINKSSICFIYMLRIEMRQSECER